MVALLSQIISSFRCIITSLVPSLGIGKDYSSVSTSVVHHWNIPLPHIIHKQLSQQFINNFDEIVIIGDIHGCYDELMELLNKINNNNNNNEYIDNTNDDNNNTNNSRILKLFVGDLVNKGPKSKEVLEYLVNNRDNCLSVRGNHDEVVIREYLKYEKEGELSLKDENKWIKDLSRNHIDYLISMSYTISIPSLDLMVVHAGLIPGVELNLQPFVDMVNMRNIIESDKKVKDSTNSLKAISSDTEGEAWASKWCGPQHIYFGHDAKRKLQIYKYSTGLDTGCVYGNYLTSVFAYGLRKGMFLSVKAKQVYSQPKGPIV